MTSTPCSSQACTDVLIDTALSARIEFLESENSRLKKEIDQIKPAHFRISSIQHKDSLVCFYTGFPSYAVFLAFYEFLGPVVDHLNYWGASEGSRVRNRTHKIDPINQLFLTLVKLRLNLKIKDISFRCITFSGIQVPHYMDLFFVPPSKGTRMDAPFNKSLKLYLVLFKKVIEIPMLSSMEAKYLLRHPLICICSHQHGANISITTNTTKFLVACTPNGAICFVSPLYVGSITDVELTRLSGFLDKLKDKPGIAIMADRGFTVKDMLRELNIELNIPPGRQQLPYQEIEEGRIIASLRIHVERAIGRIKTFEICKGTIPLSMARICNQIVCVCAFLSNFQPALVL